MQPHQETFLARQQPPCHFFHQPPLDLKEQAAIKIQGAGNGNDRQPRGLAGRFYQGGSAQGQAAVVPFAGGPLRPRRLADRIFHGRRVTITAPSVLSVLPPRKNPGCGACLGYENLSKLLPLQKLLYWPNHTNKPDLASCHLKRF